MRAAVIHGAGDVRVEEVPDPILAEPTDAIVRVVRACICGSDLHRYHNMPAAASGVQIGHELLGVVEELGAAVTGLAVGDLVVASWAWQDNTCDRCRAGVQTSCRNGGFFSAAQAEAVRVPQAAGTLVRLPVAEDSALLPSLLTLADVYPTGYHAAVRAQVGPGTTVAVVGDGAVGLLAVLSARQLGAQRIVLMGRHQARTSLGVEFGATDVVAQRGADGIERVLDLTGGGADAVLECVGLVDAYQQALGVVRPGGVVSQVGAPQYADLPSAYPRFRANVTLTGGAAPVRAYIEALLPGVLDGTVDPGRVFDRTVALDEVPAGYRAMDARESLKVLVTP